MTTCRLFLCSLAVALSLAACGCNRGPLFYSVTGSVTFQNQPVAKGQILLEDATNSGPPAVAQIVEGRYTIQTTAGEKVVRITATKETGRVLEGGMGAKVPELIDLIPAQYNTASTLRQTIAAEANQLIDFELK